MGILNLSPPKYKGKRPSFDSWSISSESGTNSKCPPGVCPNLSFDYLVSGSLRYPSRIKDFMNYLRAVEHTDENLKFLLWYRDYERRFFELDKTEQEKCPVWKSDSTGGRGGGGEKESRQGSTVSDGKDDDAKDADVTLTEEKKGSAPATPPSPGFKLKPADIKMEEADQSQPNRAEIATIASMFLYPSAPLELNLYERERVSVLNALLHTTHPTALSPAAKAVEHSLRHRSHPSFLYRQIASMNESRIKFGYRFTTMFFFLGPVFAVLLVLSGLSRWYRIIPAILSGHGAWVILMVRRGICPMLLMQKREQTEPWDDPEDFDSDGFLKLYNAASDSSDNEKKDEESPPQPTGELEHYRFDDPAQLNIFLMDDGAAERSKMLIEQDKSKPYFEKLIHNGVREVEGAFRKERLVQTGWYFMFYAAVVVIVGAIVLPLPRYGII